MVYARISHTPGWYMPVSLIHPGGGARQCYIPGWWCPSVLHTRVVYASLPYPGGICQSPISGWCIPDGGTYPGGVSLTVVHTRVVYARLFLGVQHGAERCISAQNGENSVPNPSKTSRVLSSFVRLRFTGSSAPGNSCGTGISDILNYSQTLG